MSTFLLLLGFAVLKTTVGAAIVWLGLRSRERPEEGGFGPFDASDPHDGPSPWAGRRRRPKRPRARSGAPTRGGPHRESVPRRRPQRV